MKQLPDAEKRTYVSRLPDLLNVSIPSDYFRKLMLNWDQIREMYKNGIEFGAHTMNHPILTQVPLDTARNEIGGSKDRIEKEIGGRVLGFAYPNGLTNDINPAIESLVTQTGFRTAFTLFNGPSSLQEVRNNPFAIRRVFISHKHSLSQFATLISPINRYRS
jgi:peptidoglycan/xylan/chitin deacetylase (PgdA/CDA1 family)